MSLQITPQSQQQSTTTSKIPYYDQNQNNPRYNNSSKTLSVCWSRICTITNW